MDVTTASPATNRSPQYPPLAFDLVLFDLDGTLVDPAGGITDGIAHALKTLHLPVPDADGLNAMIGPKLADALISLAGVPEERVAEVIAVYRAWYRDHGMAMSTVYPGIPELLTRLKNSGAYLAVATQKPEPLAVQLLTLHGLVDSFDLIRGSNPDETLMPGDPGYRAGKADIIAAAIVDATALAGRRASGTDSAGKDSTATDSTATDSTALKTIPLKSVMVGDRHQDVRGAHSNNLDCIGVAWGFAADGELAASGVAAVVQSTAELAAEVTQPRWFSAGDMAPPDLVRQDWTAQEANHGAL